MALVEFSLGAHLQGVQNERNTQMIKNTIIALVAAASLAGVAAPAYAAQSIVTDSSFDNNTIIARLHDQGVKATDVEEWGDLVRAYVVLEDGTQTMQFFSNDTLTPVSL
jgi:hypothetical protein